MSRIDERVRGFKNVYRHCIEKTLVFAYVVEAESEFNGPVAALRVLAQKSGLTLAALKSEEEHFSILNIVSAYQSRPEQHIVFEKFLIVDGRFQSLHGKRPRTESDYFDGYAAGFEHFLEHSKPFEARLNDPRAVEAIGKLRKWILER